MNALFLSVNRWIVGTFIFLTSQFMTKSDDYLYFIAKKLHDTFILFSYDYGVLGMKAQDFSPFLHNDSIFYIAFIRFNSVFDLLVDDRNDLNE